MLSKARIIGALILLVGFDMPATQIEAAGSIKLSGTVYTIDATARTVTLKDTLGTLTSLNVTRKTKIRRNNKSVPLTGLVLGDQVNAVADSSSNAIQISAVGPAASTVQGGVAGVSSGTGTVQISKKKLNTSGQTRMVRNGKISSLKSLTLFDTVTSHVMSPSAKSASSGTQALDIQADGPEESEVNGTIVAVNPGSPPVTPATITIAPKGGGANITLNITANTVIEVNDAIATITDLTVGMLVDAEYDPTTLDAFRIEADSEEDDAEIEGIITALDTVSCTLLIPGPCTVTITNSGGVSVTLIVDASTKIERNDATALLADLQVGDPASAEYNIVTMVAKEIEAGTESGDGGDGGGGDGGGGD
jgi:Cu/Ag efflux protein CusF